MSGIVEAFLTCLVFVSATPASGRFACPNRPATCMSVAREALATDVDLRIALSIAAHEGKFCRDAVGRRGELGTMQVLPKNIGPRNCPQEEIACSPDVAGVAILDRLHSRHDSYHLVLCHYHAGNTCTEDGKRYATDVLSFRDRLSARLRSLLSIL